jgi:reductive dehalogenase
MIFFGAAQTYYGDLNGKHRKIINFTDRRRPIVIQGDEGYYDGKTYYLPDKELFEIGYSIPESREMHRTGWSQLRGAANSSRYRMRGLVCPATQEFLRTLGYETYGANAYPITPGNGVACLHGAAEQHRNNFFSIDAELDPVTGRFELITDFPLASGAPVDAGIVRFCRTCGHCAEVCPSDSVSFDKEPTWEKPLSPFTGVPVAGHMWKKIYWTNLATCDEFQASWQGGFASCERCRTACPFMTNRGAIVHDLVRASVSNTTLFNSFIISTMGMFGFGQKDDQGHLVGYTEDNYARAVEEGNSWWDMSLPTHGYDTTVFSADGGYSK